MSFRPPARAKDGGFATRHELRRHSCAIIRRSGGIARPILYQSAAVVIFATLLPLRYAAGRRFFFGHDGHILRFGASHHRRRRRHDDASLPHLLQASRPSRRISGPPMRQQRYYYIR